MRPVVALLLAAALAACGETDKAADSEVAAAPPTPAAPVPAPAPNLADIRARAQASSKCSLDYYRARNFIPAPKHAVIDRGKFGELSADVDSVNATYAARAAGSFPASDHLNIAGAYIVTLNVSADFPHLSEELRTRSAALDAYYVALAAPAECAVPKDVLQFVGKS